ncbi:MAG: type II 3-dehydroquinate dehydratase [Muribaculaceae bacterium]|nr:type II 3-dehydroquinate dehydratase [Muribaculaceae bacterium]
MKHKVLILNGPNLNLLGLREPEIYGRETLDDIVARLKAMFPQVEIEHFQSNHEGALIDKIHEVGFDEAYVGIALNAGAYTHTSLALADAIAAVSRKVVEVHLSNVFAREEIRHRSQIAPVCVGSISGFGAKSYELAIRTLLPD